MVEEENRCSNIITCLIYKTSLSFIIFCAFINPKREFKALIYHRKCALCKVFVNVKQESVRHGSVRHEWRDLFFPCSFFEKQPHSKLTFWLFFAIIILQIIQKHNYFQGLKQISDDSKERITSIRYFHSQYLGHDTTIVEPKDFFSWSACFF